jgi:DNA helicase II / ATP-dependent DNA helicase PcrA
VSGNFAPPQVIEEDIDWVCDALRLPRSAFSGIAGDDPRLDVLRSHAPLDIEACPGSGKTTLLVAKLAILARRWPYQRRGLCVLSHTNVARAEIEQRLGGTLEGRKLLAHPHFVGTIHGFVNEFLALPWLRSLGHKVRVIDNNHCEQHRRRLLALGQFSALAGYVRPREASGMTNVVSKWKVSSATFDVVKENGEPEFVDPSKPSARQLRALCESCHRDGYHRHDEMFVWARDLLDKVGWVPVALRERFPMLFLDEVQDTSEEQSAILFRLFSGGHNPVRRQRFGDSNQAIFEHAGQNDGSTTDPFPKTAIRKVIPNSHRFGHEIAALADPLALHPHGLVGCGPPCHAISTETTGKHAIFLFDDESVADVVVAYAMYLQNVFSEDELRNGIFAAVGGVHRRGEDSHMPRSVGHYWSDYDHELTGAEPKPGTFLKYVAAGRRLADLSGEVHQLVDKIADGILRLARIANPAADLAIRQRRHRYVLQLLATNADIRASYLALITTFAVDRQAVSAEAWNNTWRRVVALIVKAICGACPNTELTRAFLAWQGSEEEADNGGRTQHDNVFKHPTANPKVRIRVGSIHSVKGQTHTATLVLDTYFNGHHLITLKPWLLGHKAGKGEEKIRNQSRLKQHYVAMTRPTHLLCLAMREDAFGAEEIEMLKRRSWRVARLRPGSTDWV